MNLQSNEKTALVLWHEMVLIGFAVVLIVAASNQQSATSHVLPVNLSPDTPINSPVVKSA